MKEPKVFFFFNAPRKPILAWLLLCIVYSALNILLKDGILSWILTVFVFSSAADCLTARHIILLHEGLSRKIKKEYGYDAEEYVVNEAISRYKETLPYLGIVLLNIAVTLITIILIMSSIGTLLPIQD